ncbi:MAG TPA: DoxX family protein [Cyclobacteriaceae bacterium]
MNTNKRMTLRDFLINANPISLDFCCLGRVIVGVYFISHGNGLFDVKAMLELADYFSNDLHFPLPLLMAYLRTGAELFGGVMLVAGLYTRVGAFLILFTMLVATFTALKGDLTGKAELTVVYALFCFVIILVGSGKYSLDNYLFNKERN